MSITITIWRDKNGRVHVSNDMPRDYDPSKTTPEQDVALAMLAEGRRVGMLCGTNFRSGDDEEVA